MANRNDDMKIGWSKVEALERRQLMAVTAEVRTYDGTGNNLAHPQWGSTDETLLRIAAPAYGDGKSSPAGATRPSARAVSNAVAAHGSNEELNARMLSSYAYAWGQFIDHDIDLTTSASPTEEFDVVVPAGDPYFDPDNTGTQTIGFTRSEYLAGTGVTNARQQTTDITSFIDGSMVYGSDTTRAAALRLGTGGLLKTSAGNLLPYNTAGLPNDTAGGPDSSYFLAGDRRANENIELTAMQTLFVREHNRLATQIATQNPTMSDEDVFQEARKLVIAEIQMITYNEFLPALLGQGSIAPYNGYHANVNPSVTNEFSTAAFRFGHSMLADDVEFLDNDADDVRDALPLSQAFFNPSVLAQTGIDPILKYLASSNSEEIDTHVVDGLRNFLFGPPGAGGFDLASLNIQRGRDHGLADYNSTRAALGMPRVTSFAQITSDVTLQQSLQSLYGSVDNIDLWVGGLAENHLAGSSLGPTFQRIIADQFTRLRDGDRFWYQSALTPQELQTVQGTRLADIIRRNSVSTNIQNNVFVFDVELSGRVFNDRNGNHRSDPGEAGISGRRVELLDEDNQVVEETTTLSDGSYEFENVQVGDYHVAADLPGGWRFTTPPPAPLDITRGETVITRLDFGQIQLALPPRMPTNNGTLPVKRITGDVLDDGAIATLLT